MDKLTERPWFKFWPENVPHHIDYPETPLFEFASNSAKKYADRIAFSAGEQGLTYSELDKATSKLATFLNEQGFKKGDAAILLLPNCLEFVIGYYGILKAGGAVCPTNPLYRKEELLHQLNDSSATAIITDEEHYALIREIKDQSKLKISVLSDSENTEGTSSLAKILATTPASPPDHNLNSKEAIAAIEYTGGTTGFPKGVTLTHYNLVANAIQNAAWFNWNDKDIIIDVLPMYHSWGACTCVNSPIYSGARVIIINRFDTEELLKIISEEKATVLYGATSMFIMLANSPIIGNYDLSSLRYVKAGAMPIPPEIRARWEQITGVKMICGYGLSEASPETHNSPFDRVKEGTIGIPIIDTDARIVDEETGKVELPPGKVGELIIKGPQVMKEYLNRPEDNEEALRDRWLYTGDLASMDEEGYFRIVDRKKETIKFKGYTIAPAEVEAAIYEHPAVKECAVVGKPDPLAGELPKAYVVLKEGCSASKDELIKFCAERVSPYKKIREVEFIDAIPKTPVGKVLRRLLRDREK
ncbi:long-chain fatty acid--CoA ligase [Chloroflexota bacterium]